MRSIHLPAFAFSLLLAACSSQSGNSDAAAGPFGGPVAGDLDTHCRGQSGPIVQLTDENACHPTVDLSSSDPPDGGTEQGPDYGDTMFNADGDDDDCKYRVHFFSTPISKGSPVTFTVSAFKLATNFPATGANIRAEVFLNDTHPAPNSKTMTVEGFSGSYTVGPVVFDASGRWTVRFHLYEDCSDVLETSPHGHAAFFIDVP